MPPPRTLALDVGDRRIGLAITDELGILAIPLFTLHRTNERADLKSIARFIRQHKVQVLVVGNPLNADGTVSAQSLKTQHFADTLREQHPTLEHHFLDERHTTQEAHERLNQSGASSRLNNKNSRLTRTEIIDQVAAVVLLESFLSR